VSLSGLDEYLDTKDPPNVANPEGGLKSPTSDEYRSENRFDQILCEKKFKQFKTSNIAVIKHCSS